MMEKNHSYMFGSCAIARTALLLVPNIVTTTSTPNTAPTTTYALPTPYYLVDVRYRNTADHYWCLLGTCVNMTGLPCTYMINATVNATLGRPISSTNISATCHVLDAGFPGSPQMIALTNYGRKPLYTQLPILTDSITNVSISSDAVAGSVLSFSSARRSCILVANYSQIDIADNQRCIFRPELCYYGLSAAAWVKFSNTTLYGSNNKLVIMGTEQSGFILYQTGCKTGVTISAGNGQWSFEIMDTQVVPDIWINIGFRWSSPTGIFIYVNNIEHAGSTSSQYTSMSNVFPNSTTLSIGCIRLSGSQFYNYADMQIAHVAIWMWRLRDAERVYLSGGLSYTLVPPTVTSFVTTSFVPTSDALYDFKSNMIPYQVSAPGVNPMFALANAYWQLSDATSTGSNGQIASIASSSPATNVPQINVVSFNSITSYIQTSISPSSCMRSSPFCSNGLSVGLILNVTTMASNNARICTGSCKFIIVWLYKQFVMYFQSGQIVVEFADNQVASMAYPVNKLDNFVSIGFTWYPNATSGRSLTIYLNGVAQTTAYWFDTLGIANYLTTSSIYDGRSLYVGLGSGALNPMQARDLVVWERYLFSFEVGRFMGLTPDQFAMFINNNNWWTTDLYAYNLMQLLAAADGLYMVRGAAYSYASDRWNKSVGVVLSGYSSQQFNRPWMLIDNGYPSVTSSIGKQLSNCITNPSHIYCKTAGISAAIWIVVQDVDAGNIQIFFNSGDSVSLMYNRAVDSGIDRWTGFTFLQNGPYIGVSVSTTESNYEMYMDQTLFTVGTWINLGFTWSTANGLRLFINGQYTGLSLSQGISIKPDSSSAVSHGRATIGRYSSDYTYFWTYDGSYTYGNFQFSDLLYVAREVQPQNFADLIGLSNNQYYYTATRYYTSRMLITGTLPLLRLMNASGLPYSYGPYGSVTFSNGVNLSGNKSGLLVGALGPYDCLHAVSVCTATGLSASMWLRISSDSLALNNSNTSSNPVVYILRTTVYPEYREGVSISASQGQLNISVRHQGTQYTANISLSLIVLDNYMNLAFVWQPSGNSYLLNIYLNGSQFATNLSKIPYNTGVQSAYEPLIIGAWNSDPLPAPTDFTIYSLAYWNSTLVPTQANYLAGMPSARLPYLAYSDIYWVFSGLYYHLQQFQPQLYGGVQLVSDRLGVDQAASLASKVQQYVLLGKSQQLVAAQSCLVLPSGCIGFFLQFWALLSTTSNGYVISSGAEDPNTQGIAISQNCSTQIVNSTVNNQTVSNEKSLVTLNILIRTRTILYNITADVSATAGSWASYAVFWNNSDLASTQMYVNNLKVNPTTTQSSCNANRTSDLVVGKASTAATGYLDLLIDDIFVKNVLPNTGFNLDLLTNQILCYTTAFSIFMMNQASLSSYSIQGNYYMASSHVNSNDQAVYLNGTNKFLSLGSQIGCASNPAACTSGLTVSIWARVMSLPPVTAVGQVLAVLVASGSPWNATGFAIYVTGASTVKDYPSVNIRFELNDGKNYWLLEYSRPISSIVNTWINYGLSWSPSVGLFAFLNGTAVLKQLQRVSPPPNGRTNFSSSTLMVGKFTPNDYTSYLDSVFDTAAFWQVAFTTVGGLVPRTLTGDCSMPLAPVGTSLPTAPAVATYPPTTNCQLAIYGVCTDKTVSNLATIGSANFKVPIVYQAAQALLPNLAALTRSVIVLGGTAATTMDPSGKTITASSSLTFLASCARVLENVAKNAQPSSASPPTVTEVINTWSNFSQIVDNLFMSSTASQWSAGGSKYVASIMRSMEMFAVTTASQLPVNSSHSIPGSNVLTQIMSATAGVGAKAFTFSPSSISGESSKMEWVSIPESTMQSLRGDLQIVTTSYSSISSMLPTTVAKTAGHNASTMVANSRILSISTYPPITNWTNGTLITVQLQLLNENKNMKYKFSCAFWNYSSNDSSIGAWDTTGCYATNASRTGVTCSCNHMTNFAVLMQPVPADVPDLWAQAFFCLYLIGLCTSILCLSWFLFCLLKFKSRLLKDDRCLIHVNLISAFLIADVMLIVAVAVSADACKVVALLIQLFVTAAFEWLYFEALHLHFAVTAGQLHGRFWKCYMPIGWILPLVLAVTCFVVFPDAYGADWRCWLAFGSIPLYLFIGSCGLFCMLALLTCLVVLCNIRTSRCREDITQEFRSSARFNSICCLLLIAGWLTGAFAVPPVTIPFQLLYVLTFPFNGLLIIIFFGVTSRQLRAIFLCRSAENKVVDSVAASLAGSLADVRTLSDKARLVSNSRPSSSRSARPSTSNSGSSLEGPGINTLDILQVPRVTYQPDPELVARLKKKQEELANEANAEKTPQDKVPSSLFEVGSSQKPIARRLLPLNFTKQDTSKALPVTFNTDSFEDASSSGTTPHVPTFIKPKKKKNQRSDETPILESDQAKPDFVKPKSKKKKAAAAASESAGTSNELKVPSFIKPKKKRANNDA